MTPSSNPVATEFLFAAAEAQYHMLLARLGPNAELPRSCDENGLRLVGPADWTSGFFPGALWLLYSGTGKAEWLATARRFTRRLEAQQHNRTTHDTGFMMFCSYGQGLRLTGEESYRDVLITSARSLASRFHPVVGCIKSWDEHRWEFPVIIDNMMNLELLFWAADATGDRQLADIAVRHAERTMETQFRSDHSCCHVVGYDPRDGRALEQATHQGLSAQSAWARGQAWSIYGYAMSYRFTRDQRFLNVATRSADYMLTHPRLPADLVPYWDFDAPDIPFAPRDVSAAAILASALFELSDYLSADAATHYRDRAEALLASLSAPPYLNEPGQNHGFLLGHSVGSIPHRSEIDVPIIYADYYFLEALLRCRAVRSGRSATDWAVTRHEA